jgi:hypothetical protein
MQLRIVRGKDGRVVAAAELATDDGLVPEVVLEDGQTEEVLEARRLDLLEDLDQALAQLTRRGKGRAP